MFLSELAAINERVCGGRTTFDDDGGLLRTLGWSGDREGLDSGGGLLLSLIRYDAMT
jgi:hypothetical protein